MPFSGDLVIRTLAINPDRYYHGLNRHPNPNRKRPARWNVLIGLPMTLLNRTTTRSARVRRRLRDKILAAAQWLLRHSGDHVPIRRRQWPRCLVSCSAARRRRGPNGCHATMMGDRLSFGPHDTAPDQDRSSVYASSTALTSMRRVTPSSIARGLTHRSSPGRPQRSNSLRRPNQGAT
jgi:hypothetical protein